MTLKVSELALSILKSVRQQLEECLNELDKIEKTVKAAPPEVIGELELTKEALQALPWKPYKSGRGSWIFRDLKNPTARVLAEALAKNGGNLELHGTHYRFSGQDNKFIAKFG